MSTLAPQPLPRIDVAPDGGDREAAYRVEAAPRWGDPSPKNGVAVELRGASARLGSESFDLEKPAAVASLLAKLADKPILLAPDRDTYLAQVSGLLAALDDAQRETWLASPEPGVAYRLALRDESSFQRWIDEPKPGKIRVIQRADGFELQTNIGKLPGMDPNGPTVPLRGGDLDIASLRRALARLKERFKDAPDVCMVPSFGTELWRAAEALSGDYQGSDRRIFDELCLVYPRPARKDGG